MKLEIIINKKNNIFEAKSPSFPNCVGHGRTKNEAFLELKEKIRVKLCESISKHLNEVLQNENATEVITGIDTTENSHQIFDLLKANTKHFLYKIPFQASLSFSLNRNPSLGNIFSTPSPKPIDEIFAQTNEKNHQFPDLFKENTERFFYPISLN